MNALQIINTPIINAILQMFIAMLVMTIINPTLRHPLRTIVILSILTEVVMDGFDFINKGITHNIFFVIYLPLAVFFVSYVYGFKKLQTYSLLLLSAFFTYFTMDVVVEGDWLMVLYPVSTQYYVWNAGKITGFLLFATVIMLINYVEKRVNGKKGIIQLPNLPPFRTGTLFSRRSSHSQF